MPGGTVGETVVEANAVRYVDYYGSGMDLVYTPMLSGLKEDIVLESYTGQNTFTFMLNTGGLNLYSVNGRCFLAASKTARDRIDLGEVVSFDARGRFSLGTMTAQTVVAGQIYRLTLTVDEAFLTDPNTVYPVSIDPSLTVSDNTHGAGAIEDVSIYQGKPTTNGNWTYLHSGYYDSSFTVSRTLFRLTGLINSNVFQSITSNNIVSAEFHIREASGTPATDVKLRVNTGSSTWTESGATWNNTPITLGSTYDTVSVGVNAWATFNILHLVRAWKSEIYNPLCGFVLQSSNETSRDKAFYSSEHSSTTNRPYVVLTYSPNEFYSTFDDHTAFVNMVDTVGLVNQGGVLSPVYLYDDDGLRLRANCYGYAFRFYYASESMQHETELFTTTDGIRVTAYMQLPGEFANKTNGLIISNNDAGGTTFMTVSNRTGLNDLYRQIFDPDGEFSNAERMHFLIQLMVADGNTLGYTVTEYTGTTIPNAAAYNNKRLIALVVSETDFHFYMQHSDNTWSHKPGSTEPSNLCIDCEVDLTNDNIRAHACEGIYGDGELKLFYISKNAVIDYGHLSGAYMQLTHGTESIYTLPSYVDLAGNNYTAAKNLGTIQAITYTGNTDYVGDIDCYLFKPSTSGTKSFSFTTSLNTPLEVILYDKSKNELKNITSQNGTVSFTYSLTANEEYVLMVGSPNQDLHQYRRVYTFTIG